MRALLAVVMVLAALWAGYWVIGSQAYKRAALAWFEDQNARGIIAVHDDLTVLGFPSRFDLTLDAPRLADPDTGYGWAAPFVQMLSLSYKPWHVIFALPQEQTYQTPRQEITLTASKLQASLVVEPTPALALDRITIAGDGLAANSTLGWRLGADSLRLATRQAGARDNAHQIGLNVTGLALDPALIKALAGKVDLPGTFETLHLEAEAGLDAPLDRNAGKTRPALTDLELTALNIRWGDLNLTAQGKLAVTGEGYPEGRIDIALDNWRKALAVGVATGLIAPEIAPTWEQAMVILATQSDSPDRISLPLVFRDGRMSLGPVPLGQAPRLN